MTYPEDDYLPLSGIQHIAFCRRQWALIHVENQWAENLRTADGALMHTAAHDTGLKESRGDLLIVRGMKIHSPSLGLSGACDVVEFHRLESSLGDGTPLRGKEGLWQPFPVEYKRGAPGGHTEADSLQLCAQAMCLEEMLCCSVGQGALYYGQTRHRQSVSFSPELRAQVIRLAGEMHDLYRRGTTPVVKPTKACGACSLKGLCLPALHRSRSAADYVRAHWEAEE